MQVLWKSEFKEMISLINIFSVDHFPVIWHKFGISFQVRFDYMVYLIKIFLPSLLHSLLIIYNLLFLLIGDTCFL
jgi:hypothetical protein